MAVHACSKQYEKPFPLQFIKFEVGTDHTDSAEQLYHQLASKCIESYCSLIRHQPVVCSQPEMVFTELRYSSDICQMLIYGH